MCLCSRAALEDSKKWGMLNLVNQLFKIYFKVTGSVNTYQLIFFTATYYSVKWL